MQKAIVIYSVYAYYGQEWIDDFLTWRPEDYGGLDKIVVGPKRMWVPKLATGNRFVTGKARNDECPECRMLYGPECRKPMTRMPKSLKMYK